MTAKTGANTIIAMRLSSVWGQAVECGSAHRMAVESLEFSNNPTELMANDVGGGTDMIADVTTGATNPTISTTEKLFFDGPSIQKLALLLGDSNVAVDGDGYKHTLKYKSDRSALYATIAWEMTQAEAAELDTGLPTSYSVTVVPNDYMRATVEFLGSDIKYEPSETTVNTVTTLANTTTADNNRIVVRPSDGLWVNDAAGGALSSADCEPFTEMTINFTRELEIVQAVRCTAGNDVPRATGDMPFAADINVSFRSIDKMDYFNAVKDGDEFKASFQVTGPAIGLTDDYVIKFVWPRLKVLLDPEGGLTTTGENPYSVTFRALVASANPTGMDDVYPYVEVINKRASKYLTV